MTDRIIYESGEGEYEEKRSKFLAKTYHVTSEEEAIAIVESVKKQYYDARHTCYAYIIGSDRGTVRAADDGEPQGTAGRPILQELESLGLYNCLLTVTRYFGGTLLGTGGLVRAYTQAAKDALAASEILDITVGIPLRIVYPYTLAGKVEYALRNSLGNVEHQEYGQDVTVDVLIPESGRSALKKELSELSNGSLPVEEGEPVLYAVTKDKKIVKNY